MTCFFEVNLGTSEVIALLSLLVAALAALYARWSWSEAKRANSISLLGHKKEIYDAFFELKMHMQQKAQFAELSEISKFYYHQKNANIYLPADVAEYIEKYFDACFWIADIHRRDGGLSAGNRAEFDRHLEIEKELSPKIEKALIALLRIA